MGTQSQKAPVTATVKIYASTKCRLEEIGRRLAAKENRKITETELANSYVAAGILKDEQKLSTKLSKS